MFGVNRPPKSDTEFERRVNRFNSIIIGTVIVSLTILFLWLASTIGWAAFGLPIAAFVAGWWLRRLYKQKKSANKYVRPLDPRFKPPPYDERRHPKAWMRPFMMYLAFPLVIGLFVWIVSKVPAANWLLASALVAGLMTLWTVSVLQEVWARGNRYIRINLETQTLDIDQTRNIWLLLTGSKPEQIPLEDVALSTPTESILDTLFGCVTICVTEKNGKQTILRDIVNYPAFKRVYDWIQNMDVRKLEAQQTSNELAKEELGESRASRKLQEEEVALLRRAEADRQQSLRNQEELLARWKAYPYPPPPPSASPDEAPSPAMPD